MKVVKHSFATHCPVSPYFSKIFPHTHLIPVVLLRLNDLIRATARRAAAALRVRATVQVAVPVVRPSSAVGGGCRVDEKIGVEGGKK